MEGLYFIRSLKSGKYFIGFYKQIIPIFSDDKKIAIKFNRTAVHNTLKSVRYHRIAVTFQGAN